MRTSTPSRSSSCRAFAESLGGYVSEDTVEPFDEHNAGAPRVNPAEVPAEDAASDLGNRSGELDARRTPSDEDKRHPFVPAGRVVFALREFER